MLVSLEKKKRKYKNIPRVGIYRRLGPFTPSYGDMVVVVVARSLSAYNIYLKGKKSKKNKILTA
jgi:hypothetical protein